MAGISNKERLERCIERNDRMTRHSKEAQESNANRAFYNEQGYLMDTDDKLSNTAQEHCIEAFDEEDHSRCEEIKEKIREATEESPSRERLDEIIDLMDERDEELSRDPIYRELKRNESEEGIF